MAAAVVATFVILAVTLEAQVTDTPSSAPQATAGDDASTGLTLAEVQADLAAIEANSSIDDAVKELLRSKYRQAIAALTQAVTSAGRVADRIVL